MTPAAIISLLAGVVFGGINFWFLVRIVKGITGGREIPKGRILFLFFGKMALLFVTIGLILWRGYVTPLPFLGGFTISLVIGILCMTLRGSA